MRHQLRRRLPVALAFVSACLVVGAASCSHLSQGDGQAGPGGPGSTGPGGPGSPVKPGSGGYDAGPGDNIIDGAVPLDVAKVSCGDTPFTDPWSPGYQEDPSAATNAQSTVGAMTLKQKADQMRGELPQGGQYNNIFHTEPDTIAGVRGFAFRDGPKGVCLAAELKAVNPNGYSTAFPVPVSRGAAFDMDLEYQIGAAIGDETEASGNTMVLAPVINILRHPAWGRAQETYGEDSYLLGRMGTALVTGIQTYLPACAKHYAANNIENGRSSESSQMDEQTLQEMYARHFGAVIKDSGVACIMASYNLVNGVKATINKHLLTDILRGEFGFRGFVLSDWWAMPNGQNFGAPVNVLQATAADGLNAAMDMELPWSMNYGQLESAIGSGSITEAQVTHSASLILEQKFRFNIAGIGTQGGLQPTTKTGFDATQGSITNNDSHIALAHRAAVESMVLLKNDKNTLPIIRSAVHTIAVVGADVPYTVKLTDHATSPMHFATEPRLGDLGSSRVFGDPAKSSGPADGIQAVAGGGITVVSGNSASAAANADFVVVVAGLTPEDEGEEYTGAGDRTTFALEGKLGSNVQNTLITDVVALNKPMVVVLEGGSVIDMPWLAQVPAVVMAWYPGMDGGRAMGELLFGDANFGGKLPITWPKQWSDEPPFVSGTSTLMDYYVGYSYFDHANIQPLFPFGYGLSYSTFKYQYLALPCSDVTAGGVVNVEFEVTNTGTVAGDEVSFLFVSYPNTQVRRPQKELKGFHRASIPAGATKLITIPLRISDLSYWDTASSSWKIESGPVQIMVGGSSADLQLKDTLIVK